MANNPSRSLCGTWIHAKLLGHHEVHMSVRVGTSNAKLRCVVWQVLQKLPLESTALPTLLVDRDGARLFQGRSWNQQAIACLYVELVWIGRCTLELLLSSTMHITVTWYSEDSLLICSFWIIAGQLSRACVIGEIVHELLSWSPHIK